MWSRCLVTPRHESMNFRRVKGKNQAMRENLADDLMERKIGSKGNYDPQPMDHMVSGVDIKPSIQLTTSEQLPDRKPHQAAPLAPHHWPSGSKMEGVKRPAIEVTSPITPKGNVSQKKRMFSYSTQQQQQQQQSQSRIPQANTARHGNMPMKALASTSEMTKSGIPVKTEVKTTPLRNSTENNVRMRSSNRRSGGKARPASFDVSLLINNEKNVSETSKDDLLLNDDIEVGKFNRNTQIQTAFRKRSQSREFSAEDDDMKARESAPTREPVPRSPTTGALISGDEPEVFMSQEAPEVGDLLQVEQEKRLSQNTSSQGLRTPSKTRN